jgi:hypothetical protein
MLTVLLITLAVTALIALVVARMDISKVGFRMLRGGEPDRVMGVIAIASSTALLVLAYWSQARGGPTSSVDVALRMWGFVGLGWGINELRKPRGGTR